MLGAPGGHERRFCPVVVTAGRPGDQPAVADGDPLIAVASSETFDAVTVVGDEGVEVHEVGDAIGHVFRHPVTTTPPSENPTRTMSTRSS